MALPVISRALAFRCQNRLQIITSLVEMGKSQQAIEAIHALSVVIDSHLETEEAEAEREQREREL